jgi:hypothetical protein
MPQPLPRPKKRQVELPPAADMAVLYSAEVDRRLVVPSAEVRSLRSF